jgi:hypothetical protein
MYVWLPTWTIIHVSNYFWRFSWIVYQIFVIKKQFVTKIFHNMMTFHTKNGWPKWNTFYDNGGIIH